MAYATLAQLKASLSIGTFDTSNDDLLQLSLDTASEQIDSYCGRTFGTATAGVRYYVGIGGTLDTIEIDDATAITEIATTTDGATWTAVPATKYQLEPLNGRTDGMVWPYTRIRAVQTGYWPNLGGQASVRITGSFGFGYIPTAIIRATVGQAARNHARNFSPMGVAGFGDMGVVRIAQGLDIDTQQQLAPYRKLRGIA